MSLESFRQGVNLMASARLMNLFSTLQNHSSIPKLFVPWKLQASHVGSSLLVAKQSTAKARNDPLPEFQFEEYRTMKIKQINKALDESIPSQQHPTILHEAMRYTLLAGGKRVHPILCIASCELVGGNESVAMPMASALEMIFTMGLVQDDLPCLDNDDLRRGKPANHKVFGEVTSILACQALLCHAIEHIASKTKNVTPYKLIRAVVEICSAVGSRGIAAGQIMDIHSEGKEVSLSELEFIHSHKTGKLAEAAVVCGALVGGANAVEIERLRKYGKLLGWAYQVCDDILDVRGSVEIMGKKVGRDLLSDKATYTKLMGMDESKKFAMKLVAQAIEELAYFDSTKAAPLCHLANYIVSRAM